MARRKQDRPEQPVGPRLRALIEESGMTQTEVAKAAGMTKQNLNQMLKPDADPAISIVRKILSAMGLNLCDLEEK